MTALVRKTEDWVQRAAAAAEVERLPLKRLRDVLHAGTRLPVRFGCCEADSSPDTLSVNSDMPLS